MFPNNGILLRGVLGSKLFNNPFASCSFINPDVLLPYTVHFDNKIVLTFFAFITFEFILSVFYLHFK